MAKEVNVTVDSVVITNLTVEARRLEVVPGRQLAAGDLQVWTLIIRSVAAAAVV